MLPLSKDGIKRMLETGVIQLLVTLDIGQIAQQLIQAQLLVLKDFDVIKQHVPLLVNQDTLQLAAEEQNAERTKRLESGSGKINLEAVKPVMLKHQ